MFLRRIGYGLLIVFGSVLVVGQIANHAALGDIVPATFGFVAYSTVGGLIIFRRDGHITGWLLVLLGVTVTMADGIGRQSWASPELSAWVGSWGWTAVFALFGALALTFPSGKAPHGSGWAARLGRWSLVALPVLTLMSAGATARTVDSLGVATENAVQILPAALAYPTMFAVVAILLGGIVSLVVKRRLATGIERAQLTWVVFGLATFGVVLVATIGYVFGSIVLGYGDPGDSAWSGTFLMMLLFPLTFGVAVLRYRLFDIDRIVSRTVSYTVVAVLLGASFFAVVTALALVMPDAGSLGIAASTLAVAALFNPIRIRVRRAVDRRFNRSHYDAQQVAAGFVTSVRDETDPNRIITGLLSVVTVTLEPATVSVWLRSESSGQ
jgi:hypothetical protein